MRGLEGRTALVTGGASGIGKATCLRLAEEGCIIGVFDINEVGGSETAQQIVAQGSRATAQCVDITDMAAVKRGVESLEAETGAIDILINNAGWDDIAPFLDTDFELWKKVVDINLYGPLHMHHAVLPGMVERGRGKVVNISSDAGRVGSSGEAVYSAAKGGIIAFTKTLARELARSNIQLNTVCPGPTDTPLLRGVAGQGESGAKIVEGLKRAIPMKRLGEADDYPGLIAFLASSDADFITGQTIVVDGGNNLH